MSFDNSNILINKNDENEKWGLEGENSLHDIIDVLSQDIKRLWVDIGIGDKRSKVDYQSVLSIEGQLSLETTKISPSDEAYRLDGDSPNNLNKCSAPYISDIGLSGFSLFCSTY